MKKLVEIITSIQVLMAMTIETDSIPILAIFTALLITNIIIITKNSI